MRTMHCSTAGRFPAGQVVGNCAPLCIECASALASQSWCGFSCSIQQSLVVSDATEEESCANEPDMLQCHRLLFVQQAVWV